LEKYTTHGKIFQIVAAGINWIYALRFITDFFKSALFKKNISERPFERNIKRTKNIFS
jgi:hypothetical protein